MFGGSLKLASKGLHNSTFKGLTSRPTDASSVFFNSARFFSEFDTKSKKLSSLAPKKTEKSTPSKAEEGLHNFNSPKPLKPMYNLKIKHRQWALASFYAMDRPILGMKKFAEKKSAKGKKLEPIFISDPSNNANISEEAVLPELIRLGPFAESILGKYHGVSAQNEKQEASPKHNTEDLQEYVEMFLDSVEYSINNSAFRSERGTRALRRVLSASTRYEAYLKRQQLGLDLGLPEASIGLNLDSVLQKKKKKMNKHKHKKLRKRTKAIRKRLGK